ncbi:conserved protein of unknown function [Streptantibioticus cattleyicolor NRRL 8057 = DSM 46488]|nr:conserved protein of unknown function [Streptantibioticus cattleyicolor NRRL 8057 = DSM 46488]
MATHLCQGGAHDCPADGTPPVPAVPARRHRRARQGPATGRRVGHPGDRGRSGAAGQRVGHQRGRPRTGLTGQRRGRGVSPRRAVPAGGGARLGHRRSGRWGRRPVPGGGRGRRRGRTRAAAGGGPGRTLGRGPPGRRQERLGRDEAVGAEPERGPPMTPGPRTVSSMEHHMRTHWDTVDRLVRWLDEECGTAPPEVARLLRVLKITEEAGEVAEAVHGVTGGNPRKGRSHTWEDVQAELCDVIVTSMVALRTITPRAAEVFEERLAYVAERSLGGQTPAGAGPVSVGSESASAIAS